MADKKDLAMVVLGIVAVIAVVGLVLLFKTAMTGKVVPPGAKVYAMVYPGQEVPGEGRSQVLGTNCKVGYQFTLDKTFLYRDPVNCEPGWQEVEVWRNRAGYAEVNPVINRKEGACCHTAAGIPVQHVPSYVYS
jgi:hypothetical protein